MFLFQNILPFLICCPFVAALLVFAIRNSKARAVVAYICVGAIMAMAACMVAGFFLSGGEPIELLIENEVLNIIIMIAEIGICLLVCILSMKHHKPLIAVLSLVQTFIVIWVEKMAPIEETAQIRIDRLAIIMIAIIAVIGGFILIYAVGYMHGYHRHHTDIKDRRSYFFMLLFIFLGAMFGLVTSKSLLWLDFFWEITSVCSFLLIGYTNNEEAVHNSFRALWMNLLGGLFFSLAIGYSAYWNGTVDLNAVVESGSIIPVACLAFAALTKSAQLPFSKWLLGAMVAPTPSSALLHSATMVKAGVYLLLRLSPAMYGTMTGTMVSIIGGATFVLASLFAISKSDAKAVLAYSTISNLGLITACAGVGMEQTVWAAIMLLVFHAVSKAMLFQAVGAVENSLHSRNIENMQGLMYRLPKLAFILIIGIAGMYLAPFGMLIAKWAAFKAFVDAANPLLIILIAFGSATTMFYWTKFLGKLIGPPRVDKEIRDVTKPNEYISLFVHCVLMVGICLACVPLSLFVVSPIVESIFGNAIMTLDLSDIIVMVVMLIAIAILPMLCFVAVKARKNPTKHVISYMNGANTGDNKHFVDAMGEPKELYTANWYMLEYFGENKIFTPVIILSAAFLVIMMVLIVGGAF